MSANVKSGVWITNEIYEKIQAGFLNYFTTSDIDEVVDFQLWINGGYSSGESGQNVGGYNATESPVQIPGNWNQLGSGAANHGRKSDGTLWSWGENVWGAIGDGTVINRSSPVQIPGTAWRFIRGGADGAAATKTDGTLWIWGRNNTGGLGINIAAASCCGASSPVQIPGTAWCCAVNGGYTSIGIKTDGTLWVWGGGASGGLGVGRTSSDNVSSPVQIPGTSWTDFGGLTGAFLARKTDGTLWSWGSNNHGQLGLNSGVQYHSSPTQVPGTAWVDISSTGQSGQHVMARKTDGTLWGWGRNSLAGLGDNTIIDRSSPVQIPGTAWCKTSDGIPEHLGRALKSDGTMWSWGWANPFGAVGDGTSISRSSPVQIPGTKWWRTSGLLGRTQMALKCP